MAKERKRSSTSNDQGRAFEYIFLMTLESVIGKIRRTAVKKDSCFETVLRSWNLIDASVQENLRNAAQAAVPVLLGSVDANFFIRISP